MSYLFTSERLGFRNWTEADIIPMTMISGDPAVMEFFPAPATPEQTAEFIWRMQEEYERRGYCYFAVDRLDTGRFIGFTGLLYQEQEGIDFMPCTDAGWRLSKESWGNGFATEGAVRCLQYGFEYLGLKKIYAICPVANYRSEGVMKKAGMTRGGTFEHPKLQNVPELRECYYYVKEKGS